MKRRWLILAAVAVFACTLVLRTPAANLVAWFLPANLPIQLFGVSGTLHHGQIATLTYRQHPVVEALHWTFKPLWLLAGRAAVQVEGDAADDLRIDGNLAASLSTLHASDLNIEGRIAALAATAGYAFVPVDGQLHVTLHRAAVTRTAIDALDADVTLKGLRWSLSAKPIELGDFTAHAIRTDKGGIEAKLSSPSGPLDVSGTATLSAEGRYALDLKLKSRPGAPATVRNLLQALGRPDATGAYRLHQTGTSPWPAARPAKP